jgi:hypothetical protein
MVVMILLGLPASIFFCSFLDFGTGWIIADMYTFDWG